MKKSEKKSKRIEQLQDSDEKKYKEENIDSSYRNIRNKICA